MADTIRQVESDADIAVAGPADFPQRFKSVVVFMERELQP
jgi:hypothetical protein